MAAQIDEPGCRALPRFNKTSCDHPKVDAATENAMQKRDSAIGMIAIQSIECEINPRLL